MGEDNNSTNNANNTNNTNNSKQSNDIGRKPIKYEAMNFEDIIENISDNEVIDYVKTGKYQKIDGEEFAKKVEDTIGTYFGANDKLNYLKERIEEKEIQIQDEEQRLPDEIEKNEIEIKEEKEKLEQLEQSFNS